MLWNCPHCTTQLWVQDENLTTSWAFSKCFQCEGVALVRKASVDLIKVEAAPSGERILATGSAPSGLEIQKTLPSPLPQISEDFADLVSDKPKRKKTSSDRVAKALIVGGSGIAMALAIGSGIYLYSQTSRLMAPPAAKVLRVEKIPTPEAAPAATAPVTALAAAPAPAQAAPVVVDRIEQRAMAPERTNPPELSVRIQARKAVLRAGPGTEFSAVSSANQGAVFPVLASRDHWYQLRLENKTAWIRGDLVQPLNSR